MSSNSTGCYWPDGSEATNYWACPHTPSMCCGEGDFCLAAKICQKQGETSFYRGACSSQNWNATGAGCPQFCDFYSAPCLDSRSGPVTIAECVAESSSSGDWYICSNGCFNSTVCGVGPGAEHDIFPMEASDLIFQGSAVPPITSTSSSSTSSPTSALTTTTTTNTQETASASPTPPSPQLSSPTLTMPLAVGLSVGVLLPICLGLFFALRARRRRKKHNGKPIPQITISQELDGTETKNPPAGDTPVDTPESPLGSAVTPKSASTSISSTQEQPVSPLSNNDRLSELQGGDETRRISEMPDWGWLESRSRRGS
ncbi:hypothetical protein B0T19DRAFT_439525 [Cercophora scortea]|uniref:Uncharacterized protein n=1 Tax=Cercophora scortea TaxID=314031 RepID=A0AAE0IWU1_9PEZI|nr:hypothetical protein B0T19DRAFT_439525 [Cercophora scortea]